MRSPRILSSFFLRKWCKHRASKPATTTSIIPKTRQQMYGISTNSTISISHCNLKQGHEETKNYPEFFWFYKENALGLIMSMSFVLHAMMTFCHHCHHLRPTTKKQTQMRMFHFSDVHIFCVLF